MATSFRDLKKSREAMFETLNKQVEQQNKKGGRPDADPRFWYPSVDKSGNGYAVIRFLPAPQGEAVPYIIEYAHGFQGPGGWYIEKSLTTLGTGTPDPASEYNREQWQKSLAPGNEHMKEALQAGCKRRKRNASYIANIKVITDTANPENNGKEFLYRYGAKIQTKIEGKMKPKFEAEKPMNPFDPWEGANFVLKITTGVPIPPAKKGFRNYDESYFEAPSALGSDEEIEATWKNETPLQPLIAPESFKSYDELKKSFDRAMGFDKQRMENEGSAPARQPSKSAEMTKSFTPSEESVPWDTPAEQDSNLVSEDVVDEDLNHFRRLAGMID